MNSNKFYVYFRGNDSMEIIFDLIDFNLSTSLDEFISQIVKKREVKFKSNCVARYGMFESLNGVEKLLQVNTETTSLWSLLDAMLKNGHIKYVIRRMSLFEERAARGCGSASVKSTKRQWQKIKKFYQNYNESKEQQKVLSTSTPRNKKFLVVLSKKVTRTTTCCKRIGSSRRIYSHDNQTIVTTTDIFSKWTKVIALM
jgi:hypothetical protein